MIKEIREFYGIPQSLMADYLLITRSHLSMAEIGHRTIAPDKEVTLLWLYKGMTEKVAQAPTTDKKLIAAQTTQAAKKKKKTQNHLAECRYKLREAQRKLADAQNDQTRCLKIIAQLPALKVSAKDGDESLVTIIEHTTRKLQEKTAEQVQLDLQLQIIALEAQVKFLEQQT